MQIQRPFQTENLACKRTLAFASLLTALITTGCSAAAPGNTEAKNYLEGRFAGCPLWTLSDAQKTDSVRRGDKFQLDYKAVLTLREDFARTTYAGVRAFVDDPRNKPCMREMGNVVAGMAGAVDATRQTVLRGSVLLIQSEQGWRLLSRPQEEFVMPGH